MPLTNHNPVDHFHALLVSNCLSQSQALMQGKNFQQATLEVEKQGKSQQEIDILAPQKMILGTAPVMLCTLISPPPKPRVY